MKRNIWKVYQMIIENCCKCEYTMLIAKSEIEHQVTLMQQRECISELETRIMVLENELKEQREINEQVSLQLKNDTHSFESQISFLKTKLKKTEDKLDNEIVLRIDIMSMVNKMLFTLKNNELEQKSLTQQVEFGKNFMDKMKFNSNYLKEHIKEIKNELNIERNRVETL